MTPDFTINVTGPVYVVGYRSEERAGEGEKGIT